MYLIGMKVYFDQSNGRLFSLTDEHILGENAKECLRLLLENNGELVTKDEIVKRVWTSKGIVVSDNAVRQTMHILRRTIQQFSPEKQLITTVPRKGYMITQAIIVEDSDNTLLMMKRKTVKIYPRLQSAFMLFEQVVWPGRKGLIFAALTAVITCALYASWHNQNYHKSEIAQKAAPEFQYNDARTSENSGPDGSKLTENADYDPSQP